MSFTMELNEVSKIFSTPAGVVQAVKEVTACFEAGEIIAISGPSGSGKSTLLGLMAGLDRPTSGRVLMDGQDLATVDLDRYRSLRIGFVFQSYNLLPQFTALENVLLPAELNGLGGEQVSARALTLLSQLGIEASLAQRRPSRLSGGEQQRVAIARALINEPPLILADEPTGNLDEETEAVIIGYLRALAREGKCVVVVTHNPLVSGQCDRILRMRGGSMVEQRGSKITA